MIYLTAAQVLGLLILLGVLRGIVVERGAGR